MSSTTCLGCEKQKRMKGQVLFCWQHSKSIACY